MLLVVHLCIVRIGSAVRSTLYLASLDRTKEGLGGAVGTLTLTVFELVLVPMLAARTNSSLLAWSERSSPSLSGWVLGRLASCLSRVTSSTKWTVLSGSMSGTLTGSD